MFDALQHGGGGVLFISVDGAVDARLDHISQREKQSKLRHEEKQ